MSEMTFNYYPQFFTATILEWKQLLVLDSMKQIIISSLQYLVNEARVKIYGSVLMPKHIHLIWRTQDGHEKAKVQPSFLKYTAWQMKFALAQNIKELEKYKVKASDRAYQFWERNSLGMDLWRRFVFIQKLN
jgi:putative transposase